MTAAVSERTPHQRREAARHARTRRKRIALGRPTTEFVDAEPARAHVNQLRAQGMGWERVAACSGVPQSTVFALVWGRGGLPPSRRIHRDTAAQLLATPLDPARVPGVGSRRRIQALIACGWSARELSRQMGFTPTYVNKMLRSQGPLSPATAAKVRDLYERLWDQRPAEDTRTERQITAVARNTAKRHGWAPPLAWDDDVIDDPRARPDFGYGRPGNAAENADLVGRLIAEGLTPSEIVAKTGLSRSSVFRLRGKRAA